MLFSHCDNAVIMIIPFTTCPIQYHISSGERTYLLDYNPFFLTINEVKKENT